MKRQTYKILLGAAMMLIGQLCFAGSIKDLASKAADGKKVALSGVQDIEVVVISDCLSENTALNPNVSFKEVDLTKNGKTVYDVDSEEFSSDMLEFARKGVRILGGCCGTTPDHIRALAEKAKNVTPIPVTKKSFTRVSSYTHAVTFGDDPLLIGERINPTGKKKFKEALRAHDMDYIYREGLAQAECGVHILDVNVGLPEIDESAVLCEAVCGLQAILDTPLQIDTSNSAAMESALRRINGKALINSVNGKEESMHAVFPLAKRYGGVVIALTLDEDGIPGEPIKVIPFLLCILI